MSDSLHRSIIDTMRVLPKNKLFAKTQTIPGYGHFLTPLRKLILDYSDWSPVHDGLRSYLKGPFVKVAQANPDVEFVVRMVHRNGNGLLRGHYVNGRDKVICVNKLTQSEVAKKVDILLNASGLQIRSMKNLQLQHAPGAESARGIWSSLHAAKGSAGAFKI
ncbi:hypothetical protein BD324DRAFT_611184 [Kockovaella imperatae]|uniref:Large ribosomal subunit protein mL43 n=1 Tax=Kockovaella imperatae TaxID=4999 RepID=A0A1Y1URF0_9TREE|nr:hypothetical protein BD324DRAFT_611184 [Kockovaella imperatae]ORX40539.1 hypothetical protein BD324DRAFT_611184 [Kockovaella imperatae]